MEERSLQEIIEDEQRSKLEKKIREQQKREEEQAEEEESKYAAKKQQEQQDEPYKQQSQLTQVGTTLQAYAPVTIKKSEQQKQLEDLRQYE